MNRLLRRLLLGTCGLLRWLFWVAALGFLLVEAREVTAQRQLTQITVFAVLFLVASFQMSTARFLVASPDAGEAPSVMQSSLAMFAASLFSVLDGALDQLLVSLPGRVGLMAAPLLHGLNWAMNLLCVVLGLVSMELFLATLRRLIPRF
jgi:hypothetical protein